MPAILPPLNCLPPLCPCAAPCSVARTPAASPTCPPARLPGLPGCHGMRQQRLLSRLVQGASQHLGFEPTEANKAAKHCSFPWCGCGLACVCLCMWLALASAWARWRPALGATSCMPLLPLAREGRGVLPQHPPCRAPAAGLRCASHQRVLLPGLIYAASTSAAGVGWHGRQCLLHEAQLASFRTPFAPPQTTCMRAMRLGLAAAA